MEKNVRNTICAALIFCLLLAAPTGWFYDLWAGEGTGQGQRPGADVQQLERQEEVNAFFLAQTPVTVAGGELAACPLARLRDVRQEGIHYHRSYGAKRSVYISEYISSGYPLSTFDQTIQRLAGGFYNRYYLMELSDGSWLCVYFDDYLLLTGPGHYPTGYVRYTTTEERRMLNQMARDYEVDPVYVLDMYRHGKVNWMIDLVLRLGVLAIVAFLISYIRKFFRGE